MKRIFVLAFMMMLILTRYSSLKFEAQAEASGIHLTANPRKFLVPRVVFLRQNGHPFDVLFALNQSAALHRYPHPVDRPNLRAYLAVAAG